MSTTAASFEAAIRDAIVKRVHEIAGQQMEVAVAVVVRNIRDAISKEVDAIALNVAKHYSFNDRGDHLLIEVKKFL